MAKNPYILALDTSSVTGWVVLRVEDRSLVGMGTIDLSHDFRSDMGVMADKFACWLGDLFLKYDPEYFSIERPVVRGGTTYHLIGLVFLAQMIAYRWEAKRYEVTVQQAKKALSGDGRASKADMIWAAKAKGYGVQDDHQADACGVALSTIELYLTNLKGVKK